MHWKTGHNTKTTHNTQAGYRSGALLLIICADDLGTKCVDKGSVRSQIGSLSSCFAIQGTCHQAERLVMTGCMQAS